MKIVNFWSIFNFSYNSLTKETSFQSWSNDEVITTHILSQSETVLLAVALAAMSRNQVYTKVTVSEKLTINAERYFGGWWSVHQRRIKALATSLKIGGGLGEWIIKEHARYTVYFYSDYPDLRVVFKPDIVSYELEEKVWKPYL